MKPLPLLPLTSLRFFAAAAIVLFHLQGAIIGNQKAWLALGVSFFFVLSGFILSYTYRDFSRHSVKAFYLSRFARLWPIHIVTFLIAWLAFGPLVPNAVQAMTIPYNITLTHAWLPISGLVFAWNGPSWSISAEVWFYLLFPLIAASSRLWALTAIIAAISIAVVVATEMSNLPLKTQGISFSPVHLVLQHPIVRMLEFALGVAAGRLFNSGYRMQGNATTMEAVALALIAGFAAVAAYGNPYLMGLGYPILGVWFGQAAGGLFFAVAIFIFAQGQGVLSAALSWRPLVYLGEISFATYMFHYIVIRLAMGHRWVDVYSLPMTVFGILAITYIGSVILYHGIEMPARSAIIRRSLGISRPDSGEAQSSPRHRQVVP